MKSFLKRIASMAAVALIQACATQPAPEEPSAAEPIVRTEQPARPPAAPAAAVPTTPVAPKPVPVQPDAVTLYSSNLPPFDGEKQVVKEPLRGVRTIDRTVPPDDLWQRIRLGFSMPNLDNALVREKTAWYAARPDLLQRLFDRSRIYLYHIVEEIEKRGLPTELALLPMVESSFNPMAYSRAHASGLWQFIPGTGKRYELKQNWWYDGRRDILDSTQAALDYLTDVYNMHGDWHLALASYNWGENGVARAIAKNRAAGKPTDYWSLNMPAETRHYVPKLQALKNIISNPRPFGVELDPIPNQPYFVTVTKTHDIDVQLAAKLAEMPVDEFIALNPGLSRPLIRASETPRIVLPADKVEIYHANLTRHDEKSLVSWRTYQPRNGETLAAIAKRFSVDLQHLKRVNGIGPRSRGLPQVLVVPTHGSATVGRLPLMYAPPIPAGAGTRRVLHTVRPGDTLTSIASRYRVSVADLKRWNPATRLAAGQKFSVEVKVPTRAKARPQVRKKARR